VIFSIPFVIQNLTTLARATRPAIAALLGAEKSYPSADGDVRALAPTTLRFRSGELVLVLGPSGSGKTTLLSLLGCVIYPSAGEVLVAGETASTLPATELARLRLQSIGFVFQSFNLLAPLTAEENVMLPLQLLGVPQRQQRVRARDALEQVGMSPHLHKRPAALSGGQMQRIAIARALVTNPPLVLCDEPTASLDAMSVGRVMQQLRTLADDGKAVVVVTHDPRLNDYAQRVITVDSGVATERVTSSPLPVPGRAH
jgi:putative ABC transport system ATP-binding protein